MRSRRSFNELGYQHHVWLIDEGSRNEVVPADMVHAIRKAGYIAGYHARGTKFDEGEDAVYNSRLNRYAEVVRREREETER